MSDSNPPSKRRFPRVRRQWERAAPAVHGFLAVGKLWDNIKKGFVFLYDMINNPIGYFVVASLTAAGLLPTALTNYLPKRTPPPEIAAPEPQKPEQKAEPPKSLAPVVPEKTKPDCIKTALVKIREGLVDTDKAATAYRSYGGREHCGWYLTVAAEPAVHTNGMWRVQFQLRDGVTVIAEMRVAPALREGDVVLVGGTIGGYQAGGAPVILLRAAWVLRR